MAKPAKKPMKILVTGGAGFIGSNFIRYYLANHPTDHVINYDALTYAGNVQNLREAEKNPHYQFIHADILDQARLAQALTGLDAVIHFAAESHVTRSEDRPEQFYRTNVDGTRAVLTAARAAGIKRVVHISTDEVYGSIKDGYFKETDKQPGDGQASSAYAKSKAQADDVAQSFFGQLEVVIARPTNNFGPYQYPEKALPRWVTSALLNQPLQVWGTGKQVRDWLFVEDNARAVDALLHQAPANAIFNIGANHQPEHPNIEIAQTVLKTLGQPPALLQMVPDPRPDHDWRYGVDTTEMKSLGWHPGEFATQLQQTIFWYRDHTSWWQPLKAEAERLYAPKKQR